MIVAGRLSQKCPVIRCFTIKCPSPSGHFHGACATSVRLQQLRVVQAAISDPIDVYVPAARRARSPLFAILQLQKKIDSEKGPSSAR